MKSAVVKIRRDCAGALSEVLLLVGDEVFGCGYDAL